MTTVAPSGAGWAEQLQRRRLDRVGIAAVVLGVVYALGSALLPAGLPGGILLQGVVIGSLNGLLAMGLVFVYRANAIVNFAQGEMGAFAATLWDELITVSHLPYLLAVPLSVAAAAPLPALLQAAVRPRLARASRLTAALT